MPQALTTWPLDSLADARQLQEAPRLQAEPDTARKEQNEYMAAEECLEQKLADQQTVVNRLVKIPGPATTTGSSERAERIADPKEFNGTREKLKALKDQLILKTSGNPARSQIHNTSSCMPTKFSQVRHNGECASSSEGPPGWREKNQARCSLPCSQRS